MDGPRGEPPPGPRGFISAPVTDPELRRRWAESGSPRQGQRLADRLTEGRPGPWGYLLFYPFLVLLLVLTAARAWSTLAEVVDEAERR